MPADARTSHPATPRHQRPVACVCGIALLLAACAPPPDPHASPAARAIARGTTYLRTRQGPDGAWRSDVYGVMRDPEILTPHLAAFFIVTSPERSRADAFLRALRPEGRLPFNAYTAPALLTLYATDARANPWAAYLRRYQLNAANGWDPPDPEFGGWGYAVDPPRKGHIAGPVVDANLSATVWAVEALRAAGANLTDPALRDARAFIERCQNYSTAADSPLDDGGFFFVPNDPLRNKAGSAPAVSSDFQRFRSYGSMTADGVRGLLLTGLPANHPRIRAGRRWLEQNFTTDNHPGTFEPDRQTDRLAGYYYAQASIAHTFTLLHIRRLRQGDRDIDWPRALAAELVARQHADGQWLNPFGAMKEDDPLVATLFALRALKCCQLAEANDFANTPP